MLYINPEDHITVKTKILRLIPFEAAMTIVGSVDSNRNNAIAIANIKDIDPAFAVFHLRTIIPKVKVRIGILAINTSMFVVLEIKFKTTSIS